MSYLASAQNTIRIRPPHQIEHIYTLKEGEHFFRKESKLDFKFDGVNYSFQTTLKGKHYLHEKGKTKKTLFSNKDQIWYHPNRYKNCQISKKDHLLTVKHNASGKSYGPFQWGRFVYNEKLKPVRSNSNYTTASDLNAFYYYTLDNSDTTIAVSRRARDYFIVIPGKEPLGPFKEAAIYKANGEELIYSYRQNGGEYLYENGAIYGPYEDLIYTTGNGEHPTPRTEKSMYFFLRNGVWRASHPDLESYSFSKRPQFRAHHFSVNVVELDNQKCKVFTNGELLMDTHEQFYCINWNQDELAFSKVHHDNRRSYDIHYEVHYKDSLLGVFKKSNTVSMMQYANQEHDYFNQGLMKRDTLENGSYADNGIYYFSPTKGWIGPYEDKKLTRLYFSGNTTVNFNYKDSILQFQDGRFYDKVVATDFSKGNNEWWMLVREGYYDQPYRNGVKYSGDKLPVSFWHYRTPDKPYVLVYQGEEQFVKPKNSNRLIGPVSPRSEIAISKDAQNYAEGLRTGNIILINERPISEGFNLVYNNKLDAFHWINIDDKNRVYLHTYELN
jgi:hypothetical protein